MRCRRELAPAGLQSGSGAKAAAPGCLYARERCKPLRAEIYALPAGISSGIILESCKPLRVRPMLRTSKRGMIKSSLPFPSRFPVEECTAQAVQRPR